MSKYRKIISKVLGKNKTPDTNELLDDQSALDEQTKVAAYSYAWALYGSMLEHLRQVIKEDKTVKPCGMATILVLLRRTDWSQNENHIEFTHNQSRGMISINPLGSFNDVVRQMAEAELSSDTEEDHDAYLIVQSRLDELMNKYNSILNKDADDINEQVKINLLGNLQKPKLSKL
jgi:hypothetical protein